MKKLLTLTFVSFVLVIWNISGCSKGKGDKITIAVIPMGTTHEYWKTIHAGALTASREMDVDIIWKGPLKEDDRDEQIQIVETFISADVSAIVLAPLDNRALVRPVREAKNKGIPTVIVDSGLKEGFHVSFVSTDNYKGGVLGAEYIGKLLNGKGKLILVRVNEGSASSTNREEGFLYTIKSKFPEINILSDNQYAGITTETALRMCENLLNRFGSFDAIWTPNESSTFGCLRALQDRGIGGKVVFVGFDTSPKLVDALRAGEIQGLSLQNPFRMGYISVNTAVAYLNGKPVEKMIDTGVTMATPENMDEPEVKALLMHDFSHYMDQ